MNGPSDRRNFLATAAAAALVASASPAASETTPSVTRLRLGGPVSVPGDDPDVLARAHRARGFRAAYCPTIPLSDGARLRDTAAAFERHDVILAEVGRWVNLLDSDAEKRKKNLETVTEGLALAEALGARCCVDIAGSLSPTSWFGPHPDNLSPTFFDAAVQNARAIVDAVKPTRTRFCYEMMAWSLPDSADACLRMVKAVDRPGFGVHLDPCNLVNSPERFYRSSAVVRECYSKLAPWIASVHVKDLAWEVEMSVHFREVRAGLGAIDHSVLLTQHAKACPHVPLMLEHLETPDEYDAARDHLLGVAATARVSFD